MSFPILFSKTATDFNSDFGLGVLSDCESCTVTQEINGEYEMTMDYPVEGKHFSDIEIESIIAVKVPNKDNYQAFRVYSISRPINMVVTIDAEHISYMLGDIPLKPFSNQMPGVTYIMSAINTNSVINNPFRFSATITDNAKIFTLKEPTSVREIMGDSNDDMLLGKNFFKDCEWDYDNWDVVLKSGIGTDKSSYIQYVYGNNVSDLTQDENITNTVTGIFPYVYMETSEQKPVNILGSVCYGDGHDKFAKEKIAATNVESYFTDEEKAKWTLDKTDKLNKPTAAQVTEKGKEAVKDFDFVCRPEVNLTINPVDLTGIAGYEMVAENLKRVLLGDTIGVIFEQYGIETTSKVIKVVYDVLAEVNNSVSVGDPKPSLDATIAEIGDKVEVNRAGIIIGKDSILAYVDKANGELGSQLKMTEDSIKSTVASYGDTWNMVPITGAAAVGGEAWTIHLYNYGEPETNYYASTGAYNGMNYFDNETGYVWECVNNAWRRKRWTKNHSYTTYDASGNIVVTQLYAGDPAYAQKMDTYTYSNFTQTASEIRSEVTRASTAEQSIISQTPTDITLSVTDPSDSNRTASITITSKNANGQQLSGATTSGTISLKGTVLFESDVSATGTTVIDGGRINTDTLTVKKLYGVNDSDRQYISVDSKNWIIVGRDESGFNRIKINPLQMSIIDGQTDIIKTSLSQGGMTTKGSIWAEDTIFARNPNQSIHTMGSIYSNGDITVATGNGIILGGTKRTTWPSSPDLSSYATRTWVDDNFADLSTMETAIDYHTITEDNLARSYSSLNHPVLLLDTSSGNVGWSSVNASSSSISSRKYKHDIEVLNAKELDPHKLYMLEAVQFKYNLDAPAWDPKIGMDELLPGWIAEDVAAIYPAAAVWDDNNETILNWDVRYIVPGMMELIKEQRNQIKMLEFRMSDLEKEISDLKQTMKDLVELLQNKED